MSKAVFVLSAGMCVGLVACAGSAGTRPEWSSDSKTSLDSNEIDTNKVATVNRWAMDHGASLIWLNYPHKAKIADDHKDH
jgi:hypothetical protein